MGAVEPVEVPEGSELPGLEFLRLAVRPGERLIVKADHPVSDDEAEWIRLALRRAFDGAPYKPPALLVEPGADVGVGPARGGALRRWLRRVFT